MKNYFLEIGVFDNISEEGKNELFAHEQSFYYSIIKKNSVFIDSSKISVKIKLNKFF